MQDVETKGLLLAFLSKALPGKSLTLSKLPGSADQSASAICEAGGLMPVSSWWISEGLLPDGGRSHP